MWWKKTDTIPCDEKFIKLISKLVFLCPASTRKNGKQSGQKDKGENYSDVSARNCSFRKKGIKGTLLTTLLSIIKKPLIANKTYAVLKQDCSVEETRKGIETQSRLGDRYFDLIVYQENGNMSQIEAIFYYIRNAFAHGSFGIIEEKNRRIYFLESKKGETIKAQMRLNEDTLLQYAGLLDLTPKDIRALRKKKNH